MNCDILARKFSLIRFTSSLEWSMPSFFFFDDSPFFFDFLDEDDPLLFAFGGDSS